jgi:hypothetical protein
MPKQSQDKVNYMDAGGAENCCGNCSMFDGSGSCSAVSGEISADCSCDLFDAESDDMADGAPVHALFIEPLQLNDADVRFSGDGYLVANARIARTGIQEYKGFELGYPHLDTVKVYRPESEVFHRDSLRSWAHRPVTNDHPSDKVTSSNWKKVAVGQTDGHIARDGQFIRVPMVVMDQETIDSWKKGKKQLSGGYQADLVWKKGKTKDGEMYDAVQKTIRGNHVAIVDKARGGPMLTIGDSFKPFASGNDSQPDKRRKWMAGENTRVITVDGIQSEMTDVAASVVLRAIEQRDAKTRELDATIARLTADAATAKATADATAAAQKTALDTANGQITALTQKVKDAEATPAKLDDMVRARLNVVDSAARILGDKFNPTGKTDIEIMRAVCDAKIGVEATKAMNDDGIRGAFTALVPAKTSNGSSGVHDTARAFSTSSGIHSSQDARDAAWDQSNKRLTEAWRTPSPAPAR